MTREIHENDILSPCPSETTSTRLIHVCTKSILNYIILVVAVFQDGVSICFYSIMTDVVVPTTLYRPFHGHHHDDEDVVLGGGCMPWSRHRCTNPSSNRLDTRTVMGSRCLDSDTSGNGEGRIVSIPSLFPNTISVIYLSPTMIRFSVSHPK